MSCGICKNLSCGCGACSHGRNITERFRQVKIANSKEDKVMCPECGTAYYYEDNAMMVNDYSYESHKYFEKIKVTEEKDNESV